MQTPWVETNERKEEELSWRTRDKIMTEAIARLGKRDRRKATVMCSSFLNTKY